MANLTQILGGSFDASTVDMEGKYELLPEGEYLCIIEGTELRDTSKIGGKMLVVSMAVLTGPHEGAKLVERLNLVNDNETAVKIAYQTLAKICTAAGRPVIQDTDELHNARVMVKVAVEKGKGNYVGKDGIERPRGDQNAIKGYRPVGSVQQTTPTATAAAPVTAAKPLPWKKV